MSSIFVILKFKCANLNFGKWSVQANLVRNEVTLVWGSLRLAPISLVRQTVTCSLVQVHG